ncbi:MAG: hypothetical protein IJT71_02105, partial [Oscillospiraceae bacterium]|nr:hypothetical protein [Oscillospiraceae bacterium]
KSPGASVRSIVALRSTVAVLAVTSLPRMGGAAPNGSVTATTVAESPSYGMTADDGAAEEAAPAEAETAEEPMEEKSLYLTRNAAAEPESAADMAAEEPPTLTLTGAGAADWLRNNGWQGESGDWYADAALLRALPEGLATDEAPPEGYDGAVRVELEVAG